MKWPVVFFDAFRKVQEVRYCCRVEGHFSANMCSKLCERVAHRQSDDIRWSICRLTQASLLLQNTNLKNHTHAQPNSRMIDYRAASGCSMPNSEQHLEAVPRSATVVEGITLGFKDPAHLPTPDAGRGGAGGRSNTATTISFG